MSNTTVAIVGAGFSGSVLAIQLLHHGAPNLRVDLIEQRGTFGPGLPYATDREEHLLNVPAARMSAFPDKPSHFLDWLCRQSRTILGNVSPDPGAFVPRRLFGLYLQDTLAEADASRLQRVIGKAVSLAQTATGATIAFENRIPLTADCAVIATGNNAIVPPAGIGAAIADSTIYRNDPWAKDACADLPSDCAILAIGTGLTMVDAFLQLTARGHTGPIHALSRRGWAPRTHAAPTTIPPPDASAFPRRLLPLLRFVRSEAARVVAAGGTWQSVVDALRPMTQQLWQGWSNAERRRFLVHLRPAWDVHRHRVAPRVGELLATAQASGRLTIHAGRIAAIAATGEVSWQPRGTTERGVFQVGRIVNCTGAASDIVRSDCPLTRALLASGQARPDPQRLGLDTTATGSLIDRDGAESGRLFGVGPVCRGALWEIVAVPDIRVQCEALARRIVAALQRDDEPEAQKCTEHSSEIATAVASS